MEEFIIEYWIEVGFGMVVTGLGIWCKYLSSIIKSRKMEQDALRSGVIALLHDRLFQSCEFYLKKGYIPVQRAEEVMDNINMIYNAYHGIGGNGTGTAVYNKFCKLHIEYHEQDD